MTCCYHDKKSESAWCKGCKRRAELVENFEQGVKSCLKNTPEEADLSAAKKIIQSFVPKFSIDVQYGDKINNWKKIVLLQAPGDADEFKEPLSNLVVGGTLNVSRDALEADIPLRFFPRVITPQAAMALQESGITCLDLRSNPYLLRLPTADLCTINTLRQLECSGCPRLYSPPPEVAESNGRDVMQFLRQCVENGALNESLAVVFIGDGEAGKTSSAKALMNEEGNTAGPIGKDMRTVGMDMFDWHTQDQQGEDLIFKIKDVGGQHVYMKLHELFVITRAVYFYVWRADQNVEQAIASIPQWLNLLQSRVPGVSVAAVVTHIDCVSPSDLEAKEIRVREALSKWQNKQSKLPAAEHELIVSVLENGSSHGIDCLTGTGVKELRSLLLRVAGQTRGFREPLPKPWVDLRDSIRSQTEKFMQWDEYKGLCKASGINDKMMLPVTSFLHETAEMRYFGIGAMRNRSENLEDFLTTVLGDGDVSDNAKELFDRIDTDKSGGIDKDELLSFLKAKGLDKTNIDAMMQSIGGTASRTGLIGFEEFRKLFESALSSSDTFSTVVYLSSEWMLDLLKGVIRHEHGALHFYLAEESKLESKLRHLVHQARRLRVQGVVSKDLLGATHNYLWPGTPSPFWDKIAAGGSEVYDFERQLWDDGEEGLRQVVRNKEDMDVALNLLMGFRVIAPWGADAAKANSDYLCPDLLPEHQRATIDSRSLVTVECPYWHQRTYAELPFGFWNNIFMDIRSKTSSGFTSTHRHTFFLLSAKLHITKLHVKGKYRIDVRASTRSVFETALTALQQVQKFYPGMAIWQLSDEGISDEESAAIQDPAHVLVLTAGMVMQKDPKVIDEFNLACDDVAEEIACFHDFIERAQTDASLDEERKEMLASFAANFDVTNNGIQDLRERLNGGLQLGLMWEEVSTLGLKWEEIGSQKPTMGTEIVSEALARGLQGKLEFSQEEWKKFEVSDLAHDSYIKVGDKFLSPAKPEGQEIQHEAIAAELQKQLHFTIEELKNLNVPSLSKNSYIKAGDKYFRPAGTANHCPGFMSLAEVSDSLGDLVACTLRPEYGRCMRAVVRQGSGPAASTAKRNQIVNGSHLVWDHTWFGKELGLQWSKRSHASVGLLGRRLTSPELQDMLKTKQELSESEWTAIGINDLQPDDFVQVGTSYFKPAEVSLLDLDKMLFADLRQNNADSAEWLLRVGADPSYCRFRLACFRIGRVRIGGCCEILGSSSAAANKIEDLQDLMHSFGCADPDLMGQRDKFINRQEDGKRVGDSLQKSVARAERSEPYYHPTSKKLLLPEEETLALSDAAKWVNQFFDEVDDYFPKFDMLKEVFCPHRLYVGKAQVVLVLVDHQIGSCAEVCERFAELERAGCKIIPVLMPGYQVPKNENGKPNFSKWWPETMPEFKNYNLFFDCMSGPNQWAWNTMKKSLMPQIHQFLEEWNESRAEQGAAVPDAAAPATLQAEGAVHGPLQERIYESKEEMRESMLPCPSCMQLGYPDPHFFNRDECMLHFASVGAMTNRKGFFPCPKCDKKVKVKDVLKRPIFLSYNWGYKDSTQKIAMKLCDRVFQATEMPYWLDCDGGMSFGEEMAQEMREGVKNCKIVILMISDAFCNSGNCLFEFWNIVHNRKHVIPLLVPDAGPTSRFGPSGWTGQYQGKDWWKHAQDVFDFEKDAANHPHKDILKNPPWDYLEEFKPIDLRGETLQDDGSLQDDSAAEQEIIQRVMSRFFRDGAAGVSEDGTAGISEDADEAVSEDEAAGVSEDTDEETIEDVELPIKRGAAGATPRGTEAGWQEEEAAVALPGTVGNL